MRLQHQRFVLTAAGLCAALSAGSAAAQVVYDNGMTNLLNSPVASGVEVRDSATNMPTTLNVEAPATIGSTASASINVFDNSILNLSGGTLDDELFLYNNGTAYVTGGTIGDDITTNDNSSVVIDAVTVDDDLEATGSSTMTINGGSFDEDVEAADSAVVAIYGGMFQTGSDPANIEAAGMSTINIYGGVFGSGTTETDPTDGYIGAVENGVVNIHGGDVAGQQNGIQAAGNGVVNIHALDTQPAGTTASGNGVINVYNGVISILDASGDGTFNVSDIAGMTRINVGDNTTVNIIGAAFKINNADVPFGTVPSGTFAFLLSDNGSNNVIVQRTATNNGSVINLVGVPEPASVVLAGLAGVGLFVARRRVLAT